MAVPLPGCGSVRGCACATEGVGNLPSYGAERF